ncbi:MAG: hypothetical protein A2017_07235 [Lentisphaerae bacterium GWF2_44_16]|nr:MAG: hypothetical protein A2017_07235 [Lentisphaerae bacterium GWF2_44_16]
MSGTKKENGFLRAGTAKSDISTSEKGVIVNDPLYAKALVLDDGKTKAVIISMDAVAIGGICEIGDDFLPKLREKIEKELKIPAQNVLVNASHTHTVEPMLCKASEQLKRTFDAVKLAAKNMEEVKIGAGSGYEDRIMINRTLRLKNGKGWTIRQSNPCPPDEEVESIGTIDPEIGIIRIDRMDGHPLAVLYNFACHPLIGVPGGTVTANYPGFASKVIEETLGNGSMAFFLQGAGGDVTEVLYKDVNRSRDSGPVGMMLGFSTLKALKGIKTQNAEINVISETVEFPRRTDIPKKIEALLKEQSELLKSLRFTSLNIKNFIPLYIKYALNPDYPSDYSYRYLHAEKIKDKGLADLDAVNRANMEKYLKNIQAMEKLTRIEDDIATLKRHQAINDEAGTPTIKAEIMGFRIGDCVLITAPVEALVEVGLRIKKASPFKHTFMAAFSNGYMHYGPLAEDYGDGGYEVTECFLAPEWHKVYEKKAIGIITALKKSGAV